MSSNDVRHGFGYGVLATVAMSVPMVIATVAGVSPLPEPIPKAIVGSLVGGGTPKSAVMALAVGSHLAYGGVFGALLARVVSPVSLRTGVGLGVALWLVAGVVVLPLLGWGFFGTAVTPKVAVATLLLHLLYGAAVGLAMSRRTAGSSIASASTSD